jgi:hypothetical protein
MSKIQVINLERAVSNVSHLEKFVKGIAGACPFNSSCRLGSVRVIVKYIAFRRISGIYRQKCFVSLNINGIDLIINSTLAGSHGSAWRSEFYKPKSAESLLCRETYQPILNDMFLQVVENNLTSIIQVIANATPSGVA